MRDLVQVNWMISVVSQSVRRIVVCPLWRRAVVCTARTRAIWLRLIRVGIQLFLFLLLLLLKTLLTTPDDLVDEIVVRSLPQRFLLLLSTKSDIDIIDDSGLVCKRLRGCLPDRRASVRVVPGAGVGAMSCLVFNLKAKHQD